MFVSRRMRVKRIRRRLGFVLGGFVLVGAALFAVLRVQAGIAVWTPPSFQLLATDAGSGYMCGVADNKVYCWGNVNTYGQLGTNDNTTLAYVPRQVTDPNGVLVGKTITGISIARTGTVCVVASNVPYCWGRGNYGVLGDNTTSDRYYPSAVTTSGVLSGKTVTSIYGGDGHMCVTASGAAYCWGTNGSGRLGDASTTQRNTPVAVNTSGVLSGKTVTKVVAGSGYGCALANSAVYCWGDDSSGTLGNDTSYTGSTTPVAVDTSGVMSGKTIVDLAGGVSHICALASDSSAFCWGTGSTGQLGNNATPTNSPVPVQVYASGAISGKTLTKLSAGSGRSCVLDTNGDGYCWGLAPIGDGTSSTKTVPTKITGSSTLNGMVLTQIANGSTGSCYLNSLGRLYCNASTSGILGNNTTGVSNVPTAVLFSQAFNAPNYRFYANADSATPGSPLAGINTTTTLTSYGEAFRVRMGVKTTPQLGGITTGGNSSCAISDGKAYCWGNNNYGQLGNNSTSQSNTPVAVDTTGVLSGKTIVSAETGGDHTCAITSEGKAYCWGNNTDGQLGNNSTSESHVPVAVDTSGALSGKTVLSITVGVSHTCVVASDNNAYCWGFNYYGQLGNNPSVNSYVPVAVDTSGVLSGKSVLSISAAYSHTCAIASDNNAYCWGRGNVGQLGNNSTSDNTSPVAVYTAGVLSSKKILSLSARAEHTCAIASDNNAYCWGYNNTGQLGDNSNSNSSVPVAVNTSGVLSGKTIYSITSGDSHTCAIASDNNTYCWGGNTNGQLGDDTTNESDVPLAVNVSGVLSGKTITRIAGGENHTCAIASDKQVYCWGDNATGQHGTGLTAESHVPVATAVDSYVPGAAINPNDNTYKLQFAQKTAGSCSAQTGFADVTGSTAIAFNTNASVSNGASITSNSNDPVPTTDSVAQTYISASGTFTNSSTITGGKTGLWDFSLKDNSGLYSTTYCVRMAYGDGSAIEGTVQYPELTTVAQIAAQQGSYRVYENADSTTPGTPVAAADTAAQLTSTGQAFRMRTGITPVSSDITATANLYKLQFAAKSAGTCSAQSTGFADVTGSTAIAFNTNASVSNGASISSTANDPVSAANSVMQTYISATGTFTNSNTITSGKTGLWDFSLKDNSGLYNTAYCLKIVYLDGTDLSGATAYPEVQTAMQKTDVAAAPFRFYQNADSLTPGSPLGVAGQPLELSSPNQTFRLRTGVSGVATFTQISPGNNHTCAIATNNQVYCWGLNNYGQLGDGTTLYRFVPTAVDTSGVLSGKTILSLSAGDAYTCVIASDNNAYCWGYNASGQLGNNSTSQSSVPVAVNTAGVLSGKTVSKITVNTSHTCVIASDNNAYCWGDDTNGQLGNNSTSQSSVPVAVNTAGVLSGKTVSAIGAGVLHTCVIASDNNAYCWGDDTYGQLGNSSNSQSNVPVAVNTAGVLSGKTILKLSAGYNHNCVVASDNLAYCWGHGGNGRLGNNSGSNSNVPVAVNTAGVLSSKTILEIAAGASHSCAIASDNNVYCWGYNANGYLADGTTTQSMVPVAASTSGAFSGKSLSSIKGKFYHTCALDSDGYAYCWGNTGSGQLGNGTNETTILPVRVTNYMSGYRVGGLGRSAVSITTGSYHTCLIGTDNQAYCWGVNSNNQLGNTGAIYSLSATPLAVDTSGLLSGKTVVSMVAGHYHTCAIASDNNAYCWGKDSNGQLGDNSTSQSSVPVAVYTSGVLSGKTVLSIVAGDSHTCAIASDNNAYCWGLNDNGQLGNNSTSQSQVPVAVDASGVLSGKTIVSISAGYAHTCAIASDGHAYCWGLNGNGQLGNNSVSESHVPVAVDTSGVLSGKTLVSISAGYAHTCAVDSSGAAYCWGVNNGRLGNNSSTESHVPVAVNTAGALSGKTVTSISAGHYFTCAIASDGQAYCWGINSDGELGNNSTSQSLVPVAVNTAGALSGKTILSISSGDAYACVLASDNQVYCWGNNYYSQLGNGGFDDVLVPTTGYVLQYIPITKALSASTNTYKLQYAAKSASTCSAQTTGFADVTASTPIAFNTNASATNGAAISTTANDPLGSSQTVAQTYISATGTFTNSNAITYGTMGMWDFSLKDNNATYGTSYCLRIAYSDGAAMVQNLALPEVKITTGTLSVGFVNSLGSSLSSPSTSFGSITALTSSSQTSTGVLGTSSSKLRVYNDLATNGWSASIAATDGPTALWNRTDNLVKYDFNDASGGVDGVDSDSLGGALTLFPNNGAIASPYGCGTTGVSLGSQAAFNEGTTNNITLFSATNSAAMGCAYDLTGIGLSQAIPAAQATGTYTIDMTITVVAL